MDYVGLGHAFMTISAVGLAGCGIYCGVKQDYARAGFALTMASVFTILIYTA